MQLPLFRKPTSFFIGSLLACLCAFVHAATPSVADTKPRDGVFFSYTGYMTTVLELKDGRFRYWFESDVKRPTESQYPLTGEYSVTGSTITLKHTEVSQPQWMFRTVNGLPTLWRPDAIESFSKDGKLDMTFLERFGCGSILILTDKSSEKVWEQRGAPSL
jgi:hypothetical protein